MLYFRWMLCVSRVWSRPSRSWFNSTYPLACRVPDLVSIRASARNGAVFGLGDVALILRGSPHRIGKACAAQANCRAGNQCGATGKARTHVASNCRQLLPEHLVWGWSRCCTSTSGRHLRSRSAPFVARYNLPAEPSANCGTSFDRYPRRAHMVKARFVHGVQWTGRCDSLLRVPLMNMSMARTA